MTDSVKFLTDWAFRELKLHRISAEPYATNKASHRVLEKAGFAREGVIRSSVFKDGRILDQFLYSQIWKDIYLRSTEIIDWQTPAVLDQANKLGKDVSGPIEIARACFEWVRDCIHHSGDYEATVTTCRAFEVLAEGK